MSTTHACGCVTAPHPVHGVTYAVSKCPGHVAALAAQPTGEAYYRAIGLLDARGQVRFDHYVAEMAAGLGGPFPPPVPAWNGRPAAEALEVGCGVSPYVRAVTAAGYRYSGVDPDEWAVTRTLIEGGSTALAEPFDGRHWADCTFGLVLAAHSLEHLPDAPHALAEFRRVLVPGGHLVLLVPDDSDPTNPDHRWFFTPETLRAALAAAGFEVVTLAARRVVEKELFLYCHARRPGGR